jgi:hypothetical protein
MSAHGKGNPKMDLKNFAGVPPHNRTTAEAGFSTPNKWKNYAGIKKDSVFDRLSNVGRKASNLAGNVAHTIGHPFISFTGAKAEYNAWKNRRTPHGGKNKSRKSRKNRKTRSRKNRKTRSRK